MIGWEEAQRRILALATPVAVETVALSQAVGRWAATDVAARRTQPAADLSSMDGYAIRHADLPGPWRVIGEAAAGRPYGGALGGGDAARIFTGAYLPQGADTILIQENAQRADETLRLTGEAPRMGQWVRPRGADFSEGATVIAQGERITPARLGLLALAAVDMLPVRRRVRVALASTGDELGTVLPDANAPMLAALLGNLPAEVTAFAPVGDSHAALAAFLDAARRHDVIITTGGASVGDHDLVRDALIAAGATIDFWKIAMRPGKPVLAGTLGEAVVLGLPGNPVSAFVTAHLFAAPLIAARAGAGDPLPPRLRATLGAPLPAVGNRTDFARMKWEDGMLVPARPGDSGALVPLAEAQALAIRPAGSAPALAGSVVDAILLA